MLEKYLSEISGGELLTDVQEQELAMRIQDGDQEAVNLLVTPNLRYVVTLAKQYLRQGVDLDDLVSEGNVALVRAAMRFRPIGKRFVSFAAPYLRDAMEAVIARQADNRSIDAPIPVNSKTSFSLLSVIENTDSPHADDNLQRATLDDALIGAIGVLNDREQKVVRAFYGVEQPHKTLFEIADEMGLKRERVRQIRNTALRKMRKAAR